MKGYFLFIAVASLSIAALTSCREKDRPKIYWKLPNGETVVFYHSPPDFLFSDHWKNLELWERGERKHLFQFGAGHSGYENVELLMSSDGSIIWIVDQKNGMIGGAINLTTGAFKGESIPAIYDKDGVELFGIKIYQKKILKREPQ
ncbi:MAG: hypothetical protein WC003_15700 [Terrimicrobiaceae bacterium]|jgi:hypothetical protein|nr:hypothetical protein [Terrimicrobiaceae bacterium]